MRSVLLSLGLCLAPATVAACPLATNDPATFDRLRRHDFAIGDAARLRPLALALVPCLSSPDPTVREDIALIALTTWMRDGKLDAATLRELRERGYTQLDAGDTAGFAAPFTALALAEIARTDRRAAWMDAAERAAMVERAAHHLEQVRDYRGYQPGEGWRHGVAHAADWLMQLALNPALTQPQLERMLAAIASQAVPASSHAYVEGEYERLARPVLYVARRGLHDENDWRQWLSDISARLDETGPAWRDRDWLARRHDLQVFLSALNTQIDLNADPALLPLQRAVHTTLRSLP
ncbi:conserved exported hypothetical protein [uncultured Stenotrophomonas sp.]|uniref:DUF2785 domain-containing protein n=1 Tax=uncultured Stenotrophomonas sp. TaxID=165438 RepID=A0A1Y5Q8C0_9GAMM|nr:conserved exported hypothetical protein [uncultured Stenotrophomonas sp.]